ncbi:porin [Holophaga foetida]|uniref:porin n=1 Tax=Holophaga foetida TaxID=35839 RepID=UPI000247332C|nr:porin [Holophaga foetida]
MKTRMALLLAAGALAFPASAEDLNWKFYGTLMTFVDNVQTTGVTKDTAANNSFVTINPAATNAPSRNRMTCGTSNLGFKGDYKVNSDLKVTWQYESSVSPDGDAPNTWGGRNCGLGLASQSWGQVLVGQWDTPYKMPILMTGAIRGLDPFDNNITGNPGFNVQGTVTATGRVGGTGATTKYDAAFNRRQGNSIQYWSPTISGFSGRLMYSVNEGKTTASATAASINPTLLSALLTYKIGTLTVAYAYEQHKDYFGLTAMCSTTAAGVTTPTGVTSNAAILANPHSKDEGHELGIYYVIPSTGTRLVFLGEQLKYHNDDTVAGKINEYKRFAWFASVQQTFLQDHKVWFNYGQAQEGDGTFVGGASANTNGLGAKQFALCYAYALGKQADVFASYYTVKNDKAGTYGPFPQLSMGNGVNAGGEVKGFGVGMLYTF